MALSGSQITRLGVGGPGRRYLGFVAKEASASIQPLYGVNGILNVDGFGINAVLNVDGFGVIGDLNAVEFGANSILNADGFGIIGKLDDGAFGVLGKICIN